MHRVPVGASGWRGGRRGRPATSARRPLGLGREVDGHRPPGARRAPARRRRRVPRRRRRPSSWRVRHRPLQVQVGVVLPREPDAAEHLDAVLGARERGLEGERGRGHGRGQRPAVVRRRPPRAASHAAARASSSAHEHVGAPVLHALELADRPTELHAHPWRTPPPCRRTRRTRPPTRRPAAWRPGPGPGRGGARDRAGGPGRGVEAHGGQAARGIEALVLLDRQSVSRKGPPVVADGHDYERGGGGTEDRGPLGHRFSGREGHGPRGRAVGQSREEGRPACRCPRDGRPPPTRARWAGSALAPLPGPAPRRMTANSARP